MPDWLLGSLIGLVGGALCCAPMLTMVRRADTEPTKETPDV